MRAEILILTEESDSTARHVADMLTARGADVVMFDPALFPSAAILTSTVSSSGAPQRRLLVGGRPVQLDALTAVWFRRPSEPVPHAHLADPIAEAYAKHQCAAFAADVWDSLECRAVPAIDAVVRLAARKMFQLIEAGRLGFELPPTLITTDPNELLGFYCAHGGSIITKVIEQLGTYCAGNDFVRFTELVSTRDLANVDAVRLCPVIVQSYIAKAFEVRVTVVGNQVFAVEIHSQESNHARLDWRRYDMRMTPHAIHELPRTVADRCRRLVARLGLCYGAIDLIVTPDDHYVFLEINPNGQYLWLERTTGLRISDALCDLLLGRDDAKSTGARGEVSW